jgi:protein-S-isoprenylcysteine O-methyltransferase Ste14
MSGSANFWIRWRVPLSYPLALGSLWLGWPTRTSMIVGAGIGIVGLIVRGLAAGILQRGVQLATSGPYAWTRNPLYLGSTILAIGFAVATNSWIVAALVGAYFAVFYPAVIRGEEENLRMRFGQAFECYRERVPAFFPRPAAQPAGASQFTWAQYFRNREYQAALGMLAAMGLLALRIWIHARYLF